MNGIAGDRKIVGEKICRKGAVGADAADLAGGDKYRIGFGVRHEALDRFGVPQIKFAPGCGNYFAAFALEAPHDGGPHHAGMSADINALAAQIEKDRRAHRLVMYVVKAAVAAHFRQIGHSTISRTSSSNVTLCRQPSRWRALLGSPRRASVSVGRK